MSDATIFYILGGALAGLAVVTTFIGLKSEKFPGKAGPVVAVVFLVLIGATATYAVLNGKHEQEVRAAELEEAGEEFEEEEEQPVGEEAPASEEGPGGAEGGEVAPASKDGVAEEDATAKGAKPAGAGGTLALAASPTAIAYDTKELSSKSGRVNIDFTNPATLEHDVAVLKGSEVLAKTPVISKSEATLSAELEPGTYTFLCTVPGHAEAGMEGTLTVK